ncbi:MAG: hypothetical protein JXA03_12185 [Bacteroidales bacterium]|nr:hypothetical protein [Bacteroidales bacterium]
MNLILNQKSFLKIFLPVLALILLGCFVPFKSINAGTYFFHDILCGVSSGVEEYCDFRVETNGSEEFSAGEPINVEIWLNNSPINNVNGPEVTVDGVTATVVNPGCHGNGSQCKRAVATVLAPSLSGCDSFPINFKWRTLGTHEYTTYLIHAINVPENFCGTGGNSSNISINMQANPNPAVPLGNTYINWNTTGAYKCVIEDENGENFGTGSYGNSGSFSLGMTDQPKTMKAICGAIYSTGAQAPQERSRFLGFLEKLVPKLFARETGDWFNETKILTVDTLNLSDGSQNGPYTVPLLGTQYLQVDTSSLNQGTECKIWKNNNAFPDESNQYTFTYGPFDFFSEARTTPGTDEYKVTCSSPFAQGSDDEDVITMATPTAPDLTINTPGTPTSAQANVSVNLQSTVKNVGSASTGTGFQNFFQVADYNPTTGGMGYENNLFTKKVYAEGGTGTGQMVNLPAVSMNKLEAGQQGTTSSNYTFPSAGIHYFRACADKTDPSSSGVITESNEVNNCGPWTSINITSPTPMPDLIVLSDSTPTYITDPAQRITLSSTIKNIGNASTGSSFYNFYQVSSQDPNVGGQGGGGTGLSKNNSFFAFLFPRAEAEINPLIDLTPPIQLNALGPNGTGTIAKSNYVFPGAGMYWIRACADKSNRNDPGTITESIEGNNCADWKAIVVGSTPINGLCVTPEEHYGCEVGTSTNQVSGGTTWTWDCEGANGGTTDSCTELKPLPMSGTLTPQAESCVISAGEDSCKILFDWEVTNPESPNTAIVKPKNVTVATGHTVSNFPLEVKYNSETFYLYNNAVMLDVEQVSSHCDSGLIWNGEICSQGAPDLRAEGITPTQVGVGTDS